MKGMLPGIVMVVLATVLPLNGMAGSGETNMAKVRFIVGDEVVSATFSDNPTSRDFLLRLPLTLSMRDFAGTEKVSGELAKALDTGNAPKGCEPSAGDIAYYAPWGNLALFYRDGEYAPGLVRMGRIDGGLEALAEISGTFEMRIERNKEQ